MPGLFNAGGLITGIDTNSLVTQLMQLERQPLLRLENQIRGYETKRDALKGLRTELTNFRNSLQDMSFGADFDKFMTEVSDATIATASITGSNPTSGAFSVEVLQLASATVATSNGRIGASINPAAAFESSGVNGNVTSGDFSINGQVFNFDFSVSSLNDVINAVNGSGIGVTASYDAVSDTVTFANTNPSDTSIINFGADDDTSNFLELAAVEHATQFTNGGGSTEVTSSVGLGRLNSGSLLNTQNYVAGAITGGSFMINGVSITVDPTTDGLSDVIDRINASDAGVRASYDANTDGVRVVAEDLGSRTVSFTSGTSNFLDVMNLTAATQVAGSDSQFSVDGGSVVTRNSNEISDVIGGVTFEMKSMGTTTITVNQDLDAGIDIIKEFVEGFNTSISSIAEGVKKDGRLANDASIRDIKNTLQGMIYQSIAGLPGSMNNVLDIGISSGDSFDASSVFQIEVDEEKLRAAMSDDPSALQNILMNDDKTGIGDIMFTYLDEITGSLGFLNDRSKSGGTIDLQINGLRTRIENAEVRMAVKEQRLRASFIRMEQLSSDYQSQAASLSGFNQ